MIQAQSLSIERILNSSIHLDGHIIKNKRFHRLYNNPNIIPILRDIWLHVDPPLLGGYAKFLKPKHSSEVREGDKVIRVYFFGSIVCVLR
jgi:hypothetical protein